VDADPADLAVDGPQAPFVVCGGKGFIDINCDPCTVSEPRSCWSGCVSVFVDDAAEHSRS